jgi:hypothetical protein
MFRVNPLQDVESRIKRIESVLSAALEPNADKAEAPVDLTDKLSTLLISAEGNSRFLGNACLVSPRPLLTRRRAFIWLLPLFAPRSSVDLRENWK